MNKTRDRSNDRLRHWLAGELGLPTLLATGPAPVFSSPDNDPALAARLERLDRSVELEDLSFAPDLRFAAACEPAALRQLRRHEGLAPAAPAVLCPDSPARLQRLIDIARNCDLGVAFGRRTPAADDLPVSFHRMNRVEIIDAAAGLVRVERGARWDDILDADTDNRVSLPPDIDSLYDTPAEAAEAGLFGARPCDEIRGMPCTFEMVLPPAGTVWLDGTWLFRDAARAEEAFRIVCRRVPPFFARLYAATDLRIGERIGLWRLPDRPWSNNQYTAVRLVYCGNALSARVQRFASTFPVEGRNGRFWRNGPLMTAAERLALVLENGLSEITLPDDTPLDQPALPALADRLRETVRDAGRPVTPLISRRSVCAAGRFSREVSMIAPRDFEAPLAQWQKWQAAAARDDSPAPAPAQTGHSAAGTAEEPAPLPDDSDTPTGESDEWQAIRAALMPGGGARRDIRSA